MPNAKFVQQACFFLLKGQISANLITCLLILTLRLFMAVYAIIMERFEECFVDRLKRILGNEWDIVSAGGLTGDAYIAQKEGQRLFLKRNTSPFLAVLSAEGLVPKLVWTKRMENGDVITAQDWLEGRELRADEMQGEEVAELLNRIHSSQELLHMLLRLGKKPVNPDERFMRIKERLMAEQAGLKYKGIDEALSFLDRLMPSVRNREHVVCHGDLNHHNIIRADDGKIYLIDWDNAMIADPAADIGMLLRWYIPVQDWASWLKTYGIAKEEKLLPRMFWYLLLDALQYVIWHERRQEKEQLEKRLHHLHLLNEQIGRYITKRKDQHS